MNISRFSLATVMLSIMLVAINLAVFRFLPWPALDFTPLHIALAVLPLSNILVIAGYYVARNPGARSPIAKALLIIAPLVLLTHIAWIQISPQQVQWICSFPNGIFFQLCKILNVPSYVAVSPEGYSYFRYYPAVVLLKFTVLQFIACSLAVTCYLALARPGRPSHVVRALQSGNGT